MAHLRVSNAIVTKHVARKQWGAVVDVSDRHCWKIGPKRCHRHLIQWLHKKESKTHHPFFTNSSSCIDLYLILLCFLTGFYESYSWKHIVLACFEAIMWVACSLARMCTFYIQVVQNTGKSSHAKILHNDHVTLIWIYSVGGRPKPGDGTTDNPDAAWRAEIRSGAAW